MRILHIVPDIGISNGVMSVVLNYAKAMPKDIVFDIAYFANKDKTRQREIENLGGQVYKLDFPSAKNFITLKTYKFLKDNRGKWQAIHIHCPHFAIFIAPFAKLTGTKKISVHCHTTEYSLKGNGKRNKLLSLYAKHFIKDKFACSKNAGEFWYKNKSFTVINNAIDSKKYAYNDKTRQQVRKELNLNNNLVIAHIGRCDIEQKNHPFILEVFSQIKNIVGNSKLVLIGGTKNPKLEKICKDNKIEDDVLFLGVRQDVSELLQGADVFLFPSISEGLPVSVIEAQAAGLPVLKSDCITDEVKLFKSTVSLSLNENVEKWAEKAVELSKTTRQDCSLQIKEMGWDIEDVCVKLQEYYKMEK